MYVGKRGERQSLILKKFSRGGGKTDKRQVTIILSNKVYGWVSTHWVLRELVGQRGTNLARAGVCTEGLGDA